MDYEKKYKEAVNKIKNLLDDGEKNGFTIVTYKTDLESIFPELNESEDERIRKVLIELSKEVAQEQFFINRGTNLQNVIAWLEKQGEVDTASYEVAENEKREFVGDGFIKCYADFQDFKEGNTYWLEYIGNDKYNVRSDNLLGKTYHITPCQLYTVFKKLTWLEKQGKQKPIIEMKSAEESLGIDSDTYNKIVDECIYGEQKIKPKFKVGDWVVNKGHSYLIADIDYEQRRYLFEIGGYTHEQLNWEYIENVDNKYHLWTIQDAKPGDVLVDRFSKDNIIILYKGINPKLSVLAYCGWNGYNLSIKTNGLGYGNLNNTNYSPATKEQRDLLFSKMHEAGYEWDDEKKELKKFHIIDEGKAEMDYCFTKMMNGEKVSSAWSEEDEMSKNAAISACKYMVDNFENSTKQYEDAIDWLKSLKDRYTWKPSDEQMEALRKASKNEYLTAEQYDILVSLYDDLKKLREDKL